MALRSIVLQVSAYFYREVIWVIRMGADNLIQQHPMRLQEELVAHIMDHRSHQPKLILYRTIMPI